MSGYQILKAMDSSKAPIYVLVKSFAASMAATIAGLAAHSFIYPNAKVLHHQITTINTSRNNLSQKRQSMKDMEETWIRYASPLVTKIGLTLEEWIDQMYKNNINGEWLLYGDKAVEAGWIGNIVESIRETGKIKYPDKNLGILFLNKLFGQATGQKRDRDGTLKESIPNRLPPCRPMDYYWIYDPDNYYKLS